MMKKSILIMSVALTLSLSACSGNEEKAKENQTVETETSVQPEQAAEVTQTEKQVTKTEVIVKEDVKAVKENITDETAVDHPVYLTKETFLRDVFNYEKNSQEWKYEGDKPCIIDFYADWCKPCKLVAPIMDELAKEYKGEVLIYKINTEKEKELASVFGIRSIPSVLFCPMDGKPQMTQGALPKETFVQVINDFLLKENQAIQE